MLNGCPLPTYYFSEKIYLFSILEATLYKYMFGKHQIIAIASGKVLLNSKLIGQVSEIWYTHSRSTELDCAFVA